MNTAQRTERRLGKSGCRAASLETEKPSNAEPLLVFRLVFRLVDHGDGREYDFFSADTHDHFAYLGIKRRRKN
jgi:hypothetical protein